MLTVRQHQDHLTIGKHVSIAFHRTLRVPDDGQSYPLPPSLGTFPIYRVMDYAERVPASWREHGGIFIPMYQREALWLSFDCPDWHPHAVQVAVGKINALTGEPLAHTLQSQPQNYLTVPDQPWLDGINAGQGFIRQFVAMPLGIGCTIEGQLTGTETLGGLQLIVYAPKPGRFPEEAPPMSDIGGFICYDLAPGSEMGLGAGGRITQKIYPDDHGMDTWDSDNVGRVYVHIVNSLEFREITGQDPPPTPISAETYTQWGLPWFSLLDEHKEDLAPTSKLAGVASIQQQGNCPLSIPPQSVKPVLHDRTVVPDGVW